MYPGKKLYRYREDFTGRLWFSFLQVCPYLHSFTARWICFPQAAETPQRTLKIGAQQWPVFSTSILISRSIIYTVMNIVMNLQQWKDIENWRKHIRSHSECDIRNQLQDWTKPAMDQGLTCSGWGYLTIWNELATRSEWTRICFSCFILFTLQELWHL